MAVTRSGYAQSSPRRSGELSLAQDRIDQFISLFAAELHLRDPDGTQLARVEDTGRLARETAERVVDTATAWQEHLGPLYDTEGVQKLLSRAGKPLSRQAVNKRKSLLALTTGSGRIVYPAFQFRDRTVISGLVNVLSEIPEELVSRWTLASWLVSSEPELDNSSPIEVLSQGGVDRVVLIARRWAKALGV